VNGCINRSKGHYEKDIPIDRRSVILTPFESTPKKLRTQTTMYNVESTTDIAVEAEKENNVPLWVTLRKIGIVVWGGAQGILVSTKEHQRRNLTRSS
jgi:hypothetical protein